MATFRISTTITASKRSSNRLSIASIASLASLASSSGSVCMTDSDNPILVTTTVSTTSAPYGPYPYPAPVPPPFTTSRGSDDLLPRPRHGAPPVAPAQTAEERAKNQKRRRSLLGFSMARKLEAPALNPALCEGWWTWSDLVEHRRWALSNSAKPREISWFKVLGGKREIAAKLAAAPQNTDGGRTRVKRDLALKLSRLNVVT
ncbi:hypothetical protein C8R46DRAFT_1024363 [Mycena filopes]|nr:hypothetical protein C8R46DRAFT_1024363 [Mycena filopes]